MRPLYHPPLSEVTVEGILYALSDPTRFLIFAEIAQSDCPQICSAFCHVGQRPVPRSTLSVHFKVLREAGLIRSERHGVEVRNTTRCQEISQRFGDLLGSILSAYQTQREQQITPIRD